MKSDSWVYLPSPAPVATAIHLALHYTAAHYSTLHDITSRTHPRSRAHRAVPCADSTYQPTNLPTYQPAPVSLPHASFSFSLVGFGWLLGWLGGKATRADSPPHSSRPMPDPAASTASTAQRRLFLPLRRLDEPFLPCHPGCVGSRRPV